ncbi:TonB-dependent receptor [Bergeyella sp. RCAD1439]|uniref:TonB-dependent receptor n=1 Tax=Bergeyella anatis TaxID=3113737 RepID=UPI002E19A7D0|nr:TonB-dependent receptor [Bergeyella sp. RCAD1439]
MKLLFQLVLLLAAVLVSAQQRFSIYGTVTDFHNRAPLAGAKITVGGKVAYSDRQGRFRINQLEAGDYVLAAEHHDCENYSLAFRLESDRQMVVPMEHHAEVLEAVQVSGFKSEGRTAMVAAVGREVIGSKSSENLGNLLSGLSGVSALKTGNNIVKPVIHGLYGSRIAVINGGVRMAEQEWGVEHAPSVETTAFQKINVIKGAGVLKYGGDASGGVVVLQPLQVPAKDSLFGEVSLSGISNGRGGKLTANLIRSWANRWFVRTGGTSKKLGDLSLPTTTLQNTGAQEQSYHLAFGQRRFEQGFEVSYSGIYQDFGIFRGSHLGGPDDFYKVLSAGGAYDYYGGFSYRVGHPRQEVSHHLAKLEAYKRFLTLGKLTFQYDFQSNARKEYDIRRGTLSGVPSMDLRLVTHHLKLEHLLERERWQLESGVYGSLQDNYPNPATQAKRIIPDYYRYDFGFFSVWQHSLGARWRMESGVRYDFSRYDAYKYYNRSDWDQRFASLYSSFEVASSGSRVLARPVLDFHNFSANVGLGYSSGRVWTVKFNLSRSGRVPNAAELFADGLHHSAAIVEIGSLKIKNEEIYQANASVKGQWEVLGGLSVELSPYLMLSDNFINQVPTGIQNSNRGVFMIWDYRQTKARLYGLDADFRWVLRPGLVWTGQFSGLRGEDVSLGEPLIMMMPSNLRNALEWKPQRLRSWFFRLENESVFRQGRYPVYNVSLSRIEQGQLVNRVLDVSTPPAGYVLFHASLGAELFRGFSFQFRVSNIFNTEYRDYLNRMRYFAPELGRNSVLTLKYTF